MALPGNLFTRDDTLFGICEGLGQDLGFNPLWLRLAFLPALFFFPKLTFAAYAALGLIVWASRTLFPAPSAMVDSEDAAQASETASERELRLAA